MAYERDYILGTDDAEVERLGLQHRVWRPAALDGWRRARFNVGQTLLDIGCGPGHATLDLAEIVGSAGRVIAIDRSRRFLDILDNRRRRRALENIETHEADLDLDPLPAVAADGAWCRWVTIFLPRPAHLIERIRSALRTGATLVLHEYLDYATWRMAPRCEELEELVQVVMQSWRAGGSEPDIALELPTMLATHGFRIASIRPMMDILSPADYGWQWLRTFALSGMSRLVELGHLSSERAEAITAAFLAAEATPHIRMITPGMMEIIAVREG